MDLTLTGIDTCTDVGMLRTLEITEQFIAVTDRFTSTERNHRFEVKRARSDSPYHPPIVKRSLDAAGNPYTAIEFHGQAWLPYIVCRIQTWNHDPHQLHVVMSTNEKDPYTSAHTQLRGPIFRLEEPGQQMWDAFLASLVDITCSHCKERPASHLLDIETSNGTEHRLCTSCATAFFWGTKNPSKRPYPMGGECDIAHLRYALTIQDVSWRQVAGTEDETPEAAAVVRKWLDAGGINTPAPPETEESHAC